MREEPHVLTVSELTRAVRATLEDDIGAVWVEGEISNYRKQASGHQYFTLKDAQSQVACVWFARSGLRLKQVVLSDGMHVQIRGVLTVYEARGQYQLNVQALQAAGAGLLQAKFEALKRKLEAEGLFDPERKRALPKSPTVIGLVTSPTGAALRDMLNIFARRAPWVRLVINPVRVQGQGAAEEIAKAVAEMNLLKELAVLPLDVLVVARGGGSIEDLWAFNEEIVARAIVASAIPVVSAVGHEIDFTIADFAADLRAATPSAAAELTVPDAEELRRYFAGRRNQLARAVAGPLLRERNRLTYLGRSASVQILLRRIREWEQRVDMTAEQMHRKVREERTAAQHRLATLATRLRRHLPDARLSLYRYPLTAMSGRLSNDVRSRLQEQKQRFQRAAGLLQALSPEATLARGFSVTTTADGRILRSITEAPPRTKIVTRLRDGSIASTVD
jgi:exodeoxyribonuclease VII large subunit